MKDSFIKNSINAGEAIQTLLQEEEIDGVQLALDLNVSPQLVSHMKTGRRNMQQDIAKRSLEVYDDPEYAMELIYEFSGGYTSPVLTGKAIEHHRLAFEEFAVREMEDTIKILHDVSLVKPPKETSEDEKARIYQVIDEITDAEVALSNLKAILAKEYGISLKDQMRKRIPYWKAKGWI
ncbi:XRE family transcriptional regulator [Bacillus sp. FJAT-49736]|uniref:XRE family transcriptional regulator n=1 Tax=Bacillus sp. FJAT-49736 TaxID=2833582 RepID=UPI001BC9A145|nr:XRE family transcriptional regulator [Bacillus sp. FJAT-49736]MBS4172083.1 XRE family transcriptional regulator [Bacillus sp. FJAT-49736]